MSRLERHFFPDYPLLIQAKHVSRETPAFFCLYDGVHCVHGIGGTSGSTREWVLSPGRDPDAVDSGVGAAIH